ncbi:PREDICTED: disease resistance protein RPP13-like isoform X2 [Ipomoea nil]|uniref:disease resistance protein RPP13-like isoform X2 n=1 Tax=Ipomoea nil TaxID=35883 RepID=UPI000900C65E|nr:PREDICTED: disease resistance protein RPP13-like isoform X2 [Ipomoea nil]
MSGNTQFYFISYSFHSSSCFSCFCKQAQKEKQLSHLHYTYTNTELQRSRLRRMACVVVLSLMRTLELEFLQPLPRPILQQNQLIPCNKHLVLSLHKKLGSLMELFDENRMDGVEAINDLETKLRDVASRIEDEIELQVLHLYEEEEEEELRIFKGIFDIFDKNVYHAFQPPENHIYVEMPQDEKSTHHCQSHNLHQTTTHHCQRLHQILHPPTGKSHPCLKFRRILHRAVQDIDAITEELGKAKEEYQLIKRHLQAGTKQPASLHVLPIPTHQGGITMPDSSHTASHSMEIMVGKLDEFEIIKEKLIQHPSKQRQVVSIKGMGGIGKTTLAKKIYEHPSITSHFDKRAWTVASQHHNKRQMLLGLLGFNDNNAGSSSDEDLALKLYQSLKHQRYLVVMDDVWSVEAWDALKTCFPDDGYGSRVLLTTRLAEVANHICTQNDFSHQMQLLEQSESWKLFNEKACKSRGPEFETIGRLVVEKCKGLPLAIIVVAGLFSKLNALDDWKNTANALSSSSLTALDDEECSRILSLSYNHLPHNLKACFLYLGVFPEDHEIGAVDLARLWLAEGLVKAFENESVDAVANRYIQDLMDRNLIILIEKSLCGRKIQSFRMHDLLHVFCVKEAQNEKLLHVVESENSCYFPQKGFRWVSIQYEDFNMFTIQHYTLKSYRSVFCFLMWESFVDFRNSNLLRVLLCSYDTRARLKNNVNTVHLRFLSVGNDIELSRAQRFLKSRRRESVELLRSWNLQTLSSLYGRVSYRFDEGGKYSKFPQLHFICCCEYFDGNPPNFVQELYGIRAADCSKEYITNIPCLKKVRIHGEGREIIACIANLAYLEQLEELYLSSRLGTHTPINNDIVLLKNLRELIIYGMGFQWEEINVLSKLPRLEVLNLEPESCVGKEWEIQEEVIFCQLIALVICGCDLKHWKASGHNFPKLEHLYLFMCHRLREIPIDFAEISTLKSFKLRECLPSAVKSAKKVQDEQHEFGNYDMVAIEIETLDVSESEKSLSEEELEVDN